MSPFLEWLQDYFDPASFECILKHPDCFQYTLSEYHKMYSTLVHK